MHEYDITLKRVLRRLTGSVLRELTGFTVRRWHNAELPEVHSRRADMLGETAGGDLVHIELQSTNQSGMALRMLEYTTAIYGQFDWQISPSGCSLRRRSPVANARQAGRAESGIFVQNGGHPPTGQSAVA